MHYGSNSQSSSNAGHRFREKPIPKMPSSRGDRRGLFIRESAVDRAADHAVAAINPNYSPLDA
jgi:hypothetical protein